MLQAFIKYIADNNLFTNSDKILLGVSGGVDSMVLCDLFLKSNFKFGIAHCNFKLRNNESDADEALVETYARQNDIAYHVVCFDTTAYADSKGISIQMAARDLRYNWFNELSEAYAYNKIAVAHHADDNIETFFINLVRGAGLNGLCGMPLVNRSVVRPLLFASRHNISKYAGDNDIKYRDDSSNAISKYARNRVRLNIIPEFEQINPAFKQVMLSNLEHLQQIQSFVNTEMAKLSQSICFNKGDKLYFDIKKMKQLQAVNLFLYNTLHVYGFKNETINKIVRALDAVSGKQFYSHTHTLLKDRDYLILSPNLEDDLTEYLISDNDLEVHKPLHLSFKLLNKTAVFELNKDILFAQFDFNKLKFPLCLRKWKHGDSFIPLGMTGNKKLSNYFSDNKYSLFDKQNQWVLTSGNDIIWLVGKRIDNRYKVDENTKQVWQIGLVRA